MAVGLLDGAGRQGPEGVSLMPFNEAQIKQLLQPINPARVLKDGKNNSHVAQQDITAHLTRIFGFGGWDKEVLNVELVYEREYAKDGKPRFEVCYKALVKVTVKDESGDAVATYTDGSMGVSEGMPKRGDAHDLAYKSAISLSTKRAAKDLGDQFGLSLYNKGQMTALVMGTLVGSPVELEVDADITANVEQQVSMGNDEVEKEQEPDVEPEPAKSTRAPRKKAEPEPAAPDTQDAAIAQLIGLCDENKWSREAVDAKYMETYKVGVRGGKVEDLNAFHALLKTGAITLVAA